MDKYYVELIGIGESQVSKEVLDENLKEKEVLIKCDYSLISAGTELSRAFALKQGFKYPVRPGYSCVGHVLDSKDDRFKKGDLVAYSGPHASVDKIIDSDATQGLKIYKLSENTDEQQATFFNLMLVAMQGVRLADTKIGDNVAVFGLGNIGIITALMFQNMGCNVIGLDPVENRCNLAKQMGLKNVSSDSDQKKVIDEFTNNQGGDITYDVTGVASVIIKAVECTRAYGQCVLLGSPRQSYECDVMPLLSNIHMKNIKVIGAFNKTAPVDAHEGSNNSVNQNLQRSMNLINSKQIDLSKLIGLVTDPKNCKECYYDLMYNKDKYNAIIFDWRNY